MTIRIEIDGVPVSTDENRILVDVAAEAGVYIPTLCYLKGKPCLGTCRVCSVKVNGAVVAACTVRVTDGLKVEVDEPETADIRKALVELLFAEGNHNCPSCEKSGRCTLQAVGYEVDMLVSRFPYRFPHRERDHVSEKIWLERDRCIFCQRCVEFVRDEATGQKIFSISHRGPESRIDVDTDRANAMPVEQVRYAVEICPVGAVVATKTDLYPYWRQIVDTNAGHLQRAGVALQMIPANGHWTPQAIPVHRDRRHRVARNARNTTGSGAHRGPRGQDEGGDDRFVRLLGLHVVLSRHGRADPVAPDEGHHSPVLAHRYQENHRAVCDRLHRRGCRE